MDFNQKLKQYAELLVSHGLNIQEGQVVNIGTEAYHRDFALMVAEAAYNRGAKYVGLDLGDPRLGKLRIDSSKEDNLEYVPEFITTKYNKLVESNAANIRIGGSEYPDILAEADPKRVNKVRLNWHMAVKNFYDEGIGKSKVHWTVAGAATPAWAKKVFPDLDEKQGVEKLWDAIFAACRIGEGDALARWREHNTALQNRAKKLSEIKLKQLHFTGPGTDLKIGLNEKALWKGGGEEGPYGVEFEPNIPTEEVFTTPDFRMTEGKVQVTRPFYINGKLIEGLSVEFKEGRIAHFEASAGADTFKEYINSDEGASRLGEVALVGVDSPIFQTGLVFQDILYDENAACHIAVGKAYKFCVEGGSDMSDEELLAIGCNDSTVHTDMMISNENVDLVATTYSGETLELITKGQWNDGY